MEPQRTLLDFEGAALNAFSTHVFGVPLKGCYFHLAQAFNRKFTKIELERLSESNRELNLAVSFVLIELVDLPFDEVIEDLGKMADRFELDDMVSEKLSDVASSFQRSYIKGETIGRNSREPFCFGFFKEMG